MIPAPSCLLLDLDDTLFPEWDFVRSGYRAVSKHIASQTSLPAEHVYNTLCYDHQKYGRNRIFDRVATALDLPPDRIPELIETYRSHIPAITFYPGVEAALATLRRSYRIAVVTDGAAAVQRRKAAALTLQDHVDTIVYCWDIKHPKPSPEGFLAAAQALDADPRHALVIGDDPFLDLPAAEAMACYACRVRTGKYGSIPHAPAPGLVGDIPTFPDVLHWLETTFAGALP